jgi:hypothetical protein
MFYEYNISCWKRPNRSDRLQTTKWIQVFTDIRLRPANPIKSLLVAFPCVCPPLAFTIKPLKQNTPHIVKVGCTSCRIVRYGVIAQVPYHSYLRLAEHLAFSQNTPAALRPVLELSYVLSKLLAKVRTIFFKCHPVHMTPCFFLASL